MCKSKLLFVVENSLLISSKLGSLLWKKFKLSNILKQGVEKNALEFFLSKKVKLFCLQNFCPNFMFYSFYKKESNLFYISRTVSLTIQTHLKRPIVLNLNSLIYSMYNMIVVNKK